MIGDWRTGEARVDLWRMGVVSRLFCAIKMGRIDQTGSRRVHGRKIASNEVLRDNGSVECLMALAWP